MLAVFGWVVATTIELLKQPDAHSDKWGCRRLLASTPQGKAFLPRSKKAILFPMLDLGSLLASRLPC